MITCTISSTPGPPTPSPLIHKSLVPKDLLESVGGLLDDPLYSDIEFVLPSRNPRVPTPRRIYASKRLLSRADYFDSSMSLSITFWSRLTIVSVFNAGFVEASSDQFTFEITGDTNLDSVDTTSEYTALGAHPEDSDEEDEAYDPGETEGDLPNSDPEPEPEDVFEMTRDLLEPGVSAEVEMPEDSAEVEMPADEDDNGEGEDGKARNVRQKVAHPSSPRASDVQIIPRRVAPIMEREVPGPSKLRVVVKDVAYATYRAVLYYVYPFFCLTCIPLIMLSSSCIRTVSVLRRCPHPSSHHLHLERATRKYLTIVRVALVPPPVQGQEKYFLVPAREENGYRIGYAGTLDNPCRARQRLCIDLQTVSKITCPGLIPRG